MSFVTTPVGFTDFFLSNECSFTLRKIYELEDVRYELEKQLESINNELEQYQEYNSELIDETERRGWGN